MEAALTLLSGTVCNLNEPCENILTAMFMKFYIETSILSSLLEHLLLGFTSMMASFFYVCLVYVLK